MSQENDGTFNVNDLIDSYDFAYSSLFIKGEVTTVPPRKGAETIALVSEEWRSVGSFVLFMHHGSPWRFMLGKGEAQNVDKMFDPESATAELGTVCAPGICCQICCSLALSAQIQVQSLHGHVLDEKMETT